MKLGTRNWVQNLKTLDFTGFFGVPNFGYILPQTFGYKDVMKLLCIKMMVIFFYFLWKYDYGHFWIQICPLDLMDIF